MTTPNLLLMRVCQSYLMQNVALRNLVIFLCCKWQQMLFRLLVHTDWAVLDNQGCMVTLGKSLCTRVAMVISTCSNNGDYCSTSCTSSVWCALSASSLNLFDTP